MQKSLCVLLCLLVLGYAVNSTTLNSTNQTTSNSNSTNKKVGVTASGSVPLYKNSKGGFYAGVDLIKDDSSWPYFGSNTVAVELGLYTSQTLLASNCLGFKKYDCQRYQCSVNTWVYNTVQYPYFTAAGPTASADAYLDYSHWNLEDYAFVPSSCYGQGSSSYGANGMTGILGLGLNNQRQVNNYYVSNPVFSLYLKPVTGNAGYLMFQKDLRFASSSSIATWKTDKDWKGTVSGYLEIGSSSSTYLTSVSLVLDAAADTIGFPSTLYSSVIRGFTYAGISCTGSNTRPTCSYGNYKSRLPKISIQLSYPSSGTFYIPPEVYVFNYSSYSNQTIVYSFTLNMKALSSNLTLENYVTPAFDNCIILSADVLSQYYIVFDGSSSYSPSISLYNASNNPPTPGSIPWYGFAIGGVVLAAIICACCRCCCRPKAISVERPLILNDQTQYIQPAVPVINYNYPQQTVKTQQPQMIIQPQPQVFIQQQQQQPQPQVYYNPPPTYYN